MNVLIGFEESGVVREAFARRGHNAWSCDIKPSRQPGQHHQCDIYKALYSWHWDLVILHPECTALTVAGNGTYGLNKDGTPKAKYHKRLEAIKYTQKLWDDATRVCGRVCFENPVGVLASHTSMPKPQYVQPWMFGHTEQKKTGLFLYNLPRLEETNNVYDEMMKLPKAEREKCFYMSPGPNRSRDRSETYWGIAEAMAEQWGML